MFYKKTTIKRLANLIIVANNGKLSFINLHKKKSLNCKVKSEFESLEKISKNILEILKIRGSKKLNLLLLMLINENRDQVNESISKLKKNREQRIIWKLLNQDKEAWAKLQKYNIEIAEALKLAIEHSNTKNKQIIDSWQDLQDDDSLSLEKFPKLYNSMLEVVLNDESKGIMLPYSPFYPEISLYNDYLLSLCEIGVFNKNLLNREFTTINERGIRDFVKRKLENSSD